MPRRAGSASSIAAICRRLYRRGYVVATEGNVSARLPSGEILVTATRVRKRTITAAGVVRISPSGTQLSGRAAPSSEARLHCAIYAGRPDVRAIVHAHPPYCTAFAAARKPLPVDALPETVVEFGRIPLVPFAVPSTGRLSAAIAPYLKDNDFFLLANHGVVACGRTIEEAYEKIERAEHAAMTLFLARLLGGERRLGARAVRELLDIRKRRTR
jgi:L-fuculose-phosphate aldolase